MVMDMTCIGRYAIKRLNVQPCFSLPPKPGSSTVACGILANNLSVLGEVGESGSTSVSESDRMDTDEEVRRCERDDEKSFIDSMGGVGVGNDSTKNRAQKRMPSSVQLAVTRQAGCQ